MKVFKIKQQEHSSVALHVNLLSEISEILKVRPSSRFINFSYKVCIASNISIFQTDEFKTRLKLEDGRSMNINSLNTGG